MYNNTYRIILSLYVRNSQYIRVMQDFNTLLAARKTVNDLPSRIKISSYINSWNNGTVRLFALSTLTIWNLTIWDEGYYTCRSINEQGEIITSSRLYIFPFGI